MRSLIKLILFTVVAIGITACGGKNEKEKKDTTSARIAAAASIGVTVEMSSCDYNKAQSCISRISWKGVGPSDQEKQNAIDSLQALRMSIVTDPNTTFDKDQMTYLIGEAMEAIGRETEAFKLTMRKRAGY